MLSTDGSMFLHIADGGSDVYDTQRITPHGHLEMFSEVKDD